MAKFDFDLAIEPREMQGKGASRRLRRLEGKVPAIVYGGNDAPQTISLEQRVVRKALENEAFYSHILTLSQNGQKQKVVIKDIQRHPYKPQILHMDFLRIDENKPLHMHVPLHFPGQEMNPGVMAGGTVTHHMVELEIKCLPKDLPEFIEIDLSQAELNTIVHLSQVKLPHGVELAAVVHGPEDDLPVVSIHLPKRVEEVEEAPVEAAPAPTNGKEKPADAKGAAPSKGGNAKK